MEFNDNISKVVAAIGIGVVIVLSYYVLRLALPILFRLLRLLLKVRLVLLIAILIVSGVVLLGTSLMAFLRHEPVPLGLACFALLLLFIGTGGMTPYVENEFFYREEVFERVSGDAPRLEQGRDRVQS